MTDVTSVVADPVFSQILLWGFVVMFGAVLAGLVWGFVERKKKPAKKE